jgi:hypothetical protein
VGYYDLFAPGIVLNVHVGVGQLIQPSESITDPVGALAECLDT